MIIQVIDELLNGKISNQIEIEIEYNILSTKEIIEKRVIQEVKEYNKKLPEYFHGLVEPLDAEKTLNGYKLKKRIEIDAEKQVYIALNAFQKNAFFVLVDNIQLENLDQKVTLNETSKISFVKLTPLVGG